MPYDAEGWMRLYRVQVTVSDFEGATAAAERALSLDPYNPRIRDLARVNESLLVPPTASPTATGTPLVVEEPIP